MSDDNDRLLRILAAIPPDAVLAPVWQAGVSTAVVYLTGTKESAGTAPLEDLERLAEDGFLERTFVERLSLCPYCSSHALNVHESCPSCASSNLSMFRAIFHFRCGYTGPRESFGAEARGLRCPKCNRILTDVGTDHDSPGEFFRCNACASMFQVANAAARCLSCGAQVAGSALERVGHRDVYSYRVSERGKAAVARGRLVEQATSA